VLYRCSTNPVIPTGQLFIEIGNNWKETEKTKNNLEKKA
jgi:hypothetical protein